MPTMGCKSPLNDQFSPHGGCHCLSHTSGTAHQPDPDTLVCGLTVALIEQGPSYETHTQPWLAATTDYYQDAQLQLQASQLHTQCTEQLTHQAKCAWASRSHGPHPPHLVPQPLTACNVSTGTHVVGAPQRYPHLQLA